MAEETKNKIRQLYEWTKEDGYDTGSFSDFSSNINSAEGRRAIYDTLKNDKNYDLGTYEHFSSEMTKAGHNYLNINGKKTAVSRGQYDQFVQAHPDGRSQRRPAASVAGIVGGGDTAMNGSAQGGEGQKQTQGAGAGQQPNTAAGQEQDFDFRTSYDEMQKKQQEEHDTIMPFSKETVDRQKEERRQRMMQREGKDVPDNYVERQDSSDDYRIIRSDESMEENEQRMRDEEIWENERKAEVKGIMQSDVLPVLEQEDENARQRMERDWEKQGLKDGMITGSGNQALTQSMMMAAAAEREYDPKKLMALVNNTIKPNDPDSPLSKKMADLATQRIFGNAGAENETSENSKPLTDREKQAIDQMYGKELSAIAEEVQKQIYDYYAGQNAPDNVLAYIANGAVQDSLTGSLYRTLINKMAGSSGLREQMRKQMYQRYGEHLYTQLEDKLGEKAGWMAAGAANAAKGAASMLIDSAAFGLAGKPASFAGGILSKTAVGAGVRSAIGAGGKLAFGTKMALGAVRSGMTFANYDLMNTATSQWENNQWDAGELAKAWAGGLKTGAELGAVGTMTGEWIGRATNDVAKYSRAFGGYAAEVGLFSLNGIIDKANQEDKDVWDVALSGEGAKIVGEQAAMIGMLKAKELPSLIAQRNYEITRRGMGLTGEWRQILKDKGIDINSFWDALKTGYQMKKGEAGAIEQKAYDRNGWKVNVSEGQQSAIDMYRKIMDDDTLPQNMKGYFTYLMTGKYVMPTPVMQYEMRQENGVAKFTTKDAEGKVIDVYTLNAEDEAGEAQKLQNEIRLNNTTMLEQTAANPMTEMPAAIMELQKQTGMKYADIVTAMAAADKGEGTEEQNRIYRQLKAIARRRTASNIYMNVPKIRKDVSDETGVDIYDALHTGKPTEEQTKAIDLYNEKLSTLLGQKTAENEARSTMAEGQEIGEKVETPEQKKTVGDAVREASQLIDPEIRQKIDEFGDDEDGLAEYLGNIKEITEDYEGISNYVRAKGALKDVVKKANDEVKQAVEQYGTEMQQHVDSNGNMVSATVKGKKVIMHGYDPDAEINYYYDAETGEVSKVKTSDISDVESASYKDLMNTFAEQKEKEVSQQLAGDLNHHEKTQRGEYAPNTVVSFFGKDGKEEKMMIGMKNANGEYEVTYGDTDKNNQWVPTGSDTYTEVIGRDNGQRTTESGGEGPTLPENGEGQIKAEGPETPALNAGDMNGRKADTPETEAPKVETSTEEGKPYEEGSVTDKLINGNEYIGIYPFGLQTGSLNIGKSKVDQMRIAKTLGSYADKSNSWEEMHSKITSGGNGWSIMIDELTEVKKLFELFKNGKISRQQFENAFYEPNYKVKETTTETPAGPDEAAAVAAERKQSAYDMIPDVVDEKTGKTRKAYTQAPVEQTRQALLEKYGQDEDGKGIVAAIADDMINDAVKRREKAEDPDEKAAAFREKLYWERVKTYDQLQEAKAKTEADKAEGRKNIDSAMKSVIDNYGREPKTFDEVDRMMKEDIAGIKDENVRKAMEEYWEEKQDAVYDALGEKYWRKYLDDKAEEYGSVKDALDSMSNDEIEKMLLDLGADQMYWLKNNANPKSFKRTRIYKRMAERDSTDIKSIMKEIADENQKAYEEEQARKAAMNNQQGEDGIRWRDGDEEDFSDIKPVGKNRFGNIYDQFKNKAKQAFDFLFQKKEGYLKAVYHRNEVGDIDLVWGDAPNQYNGKGLAHIIAKHVNFLGDFESEQQAAEMIDDIIRTGEYRETNDPTLIDFIKGNYKVAVAKNKEGNWVLSAFDFVTPKKEKLRRKDAATFGTAGQPTENVEEARAVTSSLSDGKGTENSGDEQEIQQKIAADDEKYLSAVESGDMKTAEEMVMEKADRQLNETLQLPTDEGVIGFKYHRGAAPKKVRTMYAVLNVTPDGLKAAYAGNRTGTPIGVWLDAQPLKSWESDIKKNDDGSWSRYVAGDTGANWKDMFTEEQYERMMKEDPTITRGTRWLYERGGKHGTDVPNFSQMNTRQNEAGEKVRSPKEGALPANKLIFEIECGMDENGDLTEYVEENGRFVKKKNQGLDWVGTNKFYFFKTNPNAVGNWGIAGTFRIKRLVPHDEVVRECEKAGVQVQKWVGGYHPENFGLTVEKVDEMYEKGKRMKLLDPVTYDDNGNVIPLSQRFSDREDLRFRDDETRKTENGFYSPAEKAVRGVKQEKATGEQWLRMIEKAGGLKKEEDKWMGLSDWLKDKKSVTKQEVLDYIRENSVEVKEVKYADAEDMDSDDAMKQQIYDSPEWEALRERMTMYDEEENGYVDQSEYQKLRMTDRNFRDGFSLDYWGEELEVDDPVKAAAYLGINVDQPINDTRLTYTTEGLKQKKEIALVVPTVESYEGDMPDVHFTDEATGGKAVAWCRFGDYTDKDGKKVLVIDEIQSQRHQDAREKGYSSKELSDARQAFKEASDRLRDFQMKMQRKYGFGKQEGITEEELAERKRLNDEARAAEKRMIEAAKQTNMNGVPDAPFQKNWHELVMKRMLRYAAENGYDMVAWTDGRTQSMRYSIGNVVDRIESGIDVDGNRHMTINVKRDGHTERIYIDFDDEGKITDNRGTSDDIASTFADAKNIADVVGKEMAAKILAQTEKGVEGIKTYSGENIEIGGEGMKGFYDQMLPRYMNKYGKKWGVKVEPDHFDGLKDGASGYEKDGGLDMWTVPVTEEMRKSVMEEGQAMWRKGNAMNGNAKEEELPEEVTGGWKVNSKDTDQRHIEESVINTGNRLNVKVNVIHRGEEGQFSDMIQTRLRRGGKGWFNPRTGEVYIYLDNASNVGDAVKTMLHEIVGHKGLRDLLGKEEYDGIMVDLYGELPDEVKKSVTELAEKKYKGDISVAMDEYFAGKAEEGVTPTWWGKVTGAIRNALRKVFGMDLELTDGDIKYMLWKSYKGLVNERDVFDVADDIAMRVRNKIGEYENRKSSDDIRYAGEGDKSLVGVHNISVANLRKALKMGGLANPSVAVIDADRNGFEEFGEVSIVLPKDMVDKETGRNAGTWKGDVWTPTYPKVWKKFTKKGQKAFEKLVNSTEGNKEFKSWMMRNELNEMEVGHEPDLRWLFLKEKGIDATDYTRRGFNSKWEDAMDDYETADEMKEAMKKDEKLSKQITDMAKEWLISKVEAENPELKFNHGDSVQEFRRKRMAVREIIKERYTDAEGNLRENVITDAFNDQKEAFGRKGLLDNLGTLSRAQRLVDRRGMEDEYQTWLKNKMEELGTEELLSKGYSRGREQFVPNSLENASEIMNGEKLTGGGNFGGWGTFAGKVYGHMESLDDIRANKGKLGGDNEERKYVRENFSNMAKMLHDYSSDIDLWDGTAARILADIVMKSGNDVKKYVKKRWGIELEDDDAENLGKFTDAFRNSTEDYFETKFNRVVGLDEAAGAVVPNTLDKETRKALEEKGLKIFEYDPKKEGDRRRALTEASDMEDVRFRFAGERGMQNNEQAMKDLEVAKRMEQEEYDDPDKDVSMEEWRQLGIDSEEKLKAYKDREKRRAIKMATGWERGKDGKWRYETPDFEGKITFSGDAQVRNEEGYKRYHELIRKRNAYALGVNEHDLSPEEMKEFGDLKAKYGKNGISTWQKTDKLPSFVKDDRLFEMYPKMKDVEVSFKTMKDNEKGVLVEPSLDDIMNGTAKLPFRIELNSRMSEEEATSTLAHEVQHGVQMMEGFARGGSPESSIKKILEIGKKMGIPKGSKMSIADMKSYLGYIKPETYNSLLDEAMKNGYRDIEDWIDALNPFTYYHRLAGEVEARNVQSRMNYTPEQRRQTLAEETEDVTRDKQVVEYEGSGEDRLILGEKGAKSLDEFEKDREKNLRIIERLERQIGIHGKEDMKEERQRYEQRFEDEGEMRMKQLKVALRMAKQRRNAADIRRATGWEQGKDNKWRYEIGDAAVKEKLFKAIDKNPVMAIGGRTDLEKVIDDPELFEAYPDMKFVGVHFYNDKDSSYRGYARGNEIWINLHDYMAVKDQINEGDVDADLADVLVKMEREGVNETMNHEIQHVIQSKEGFAEGGNSENVRDLLKKMLEGNEDMNDESQRRLEVHGMLVSNSYGIGRAAALLKNPKRFLKMGEHYRYSGSFKDLVAKGQQLAVEDYWRAMDDIEDDARRWGVDLEDYGVYMDTFWQRVNTMQNNGMTPEEIAKKMLYAKEAEKAYKAIVKASEKDITEGDDRNIVRRYKELEDTLGKYYTDFELYKKLAGEVEARNVQKRMGMSQEERRNRTLEDSEDVKRTDQIAVRWNGQQMMGSKLQEDEEVVIRANERNTYTTRSGEKLAMRQLSFDFDEAPEVKNENDNHNENREVTPVDFRLKKLKDGEECWLERRYTEDGTFSFMGKNKIESADDVAYMFKRLEDKAVENGFFVLVDKDGKATIIHAGMGGMTQTDVDLTAASLAMQNLRPVKVYMVHNHPSGKLQPSAADKQLLHATRNRFGDITQEGIIIDTTSGKYATFDEFDYKDSNRMPEAPETESEYKVYKFDQQVFSPDWKPSGKNQIETPEDIAAFVSAHRLGNHAKLGMLTLTNNADITGNFVLPMDFSGDVDVDEAARELANMAESTGGRCIIIYGNQRPKISVMRDLKNAMKSMNGPNLLDVVELNGNYQSVYSANSWGALEEGTKYNGSEAYEEGMKAGEDEESGKKKKEKRTLASRSRRLIEEGFTNWRDYVLISVGGGMKFTMKSKGMTKSIVEHLTGRSKDIPLFMRDNRSGQLPEVAAERLWEGMPEGLKTQCTDQDVFNEILDIIGTYGNYNEMLDVAERSHNADTTGMEEYEQQAKDEWAQEQGYKDYDDWEAQQLWKKMGFKDKEEMMDYEDMLNQVYGEDAARTGKSTNRDLTQRQKDEAVGEWLKAHGFRGEKTFESWKTDMEKQRRQLWTEQQQNANRERARRKFLENRGFKNEIDYENRMDELLTKQKQKERLTDKYRAQLQEEMDKYGKLFDFNENGMPIAPVKSHDETLDQYLDKLGDYSKIFNIWAKLHPESKKVYDESQKIVMRAINKALKSDAISKAGKREFDRLIDDVRKARAENLSGVVQDALRTVNRIVVRDQQEKIDKILKMKVQDVNGRNMSVAKNVDDRTRRTMTKLLEYANGDHSSKWIKEQLAKLSDKMDNYVEKVADADDAGKTIEDEDRWTPEDGETMAALEIVRRIDEGKETQGDLDELEGDIAKLQMQLKDLSSVWKDGQFVGDRKEYLARRNKINTKIHALNLKATMVSGQRIEQQADLLKNLDELMMGGRNALLDKMENEQARRLELVRGAFDDLRGSGKKVNVQEAHKYLDEKWYKKIFTSALSSFEYMCQNVVTKGLGKDGYMYRRFILGRDGVVEANNTYSQNMRADVRELDDKCEEIYGEGKTFEKVTKDNEKVVQNTGIHVFDLNDLDHPERKYEISLSKGQAMYVYMVWKMDDGRAQLELQGFNDESMDEVEEFIGKENMEMADWLQDNFLQKLRERYNDKYLEIYNTSLAEIRNYVPLKRIKEQTRQDSDLSNNKGQQSHSLVEKAGSLINRRNNNVEVALSNSAFDVIFDHINQMEEWNAFAGVRRDLDYLLGSAYFRNQMNRNSAGSFRRFEAAAEIAAHAEKNKERSNMDEVIAVLQKGLVGAPIAYRNTTALKQILSVPAFLGYSQDYRFIAAFMKNVIGQYGGNAPAIIGNMVTFGTFGKRMFKNRAEAKGRLKGGLTETMGWCMNNVPDFYDRVMSMQAGDSSLDDSVSSKIGKMINKYLEQGMVSNQLVDAVTCAIGIKTIYDYKMARAKERYDEMNLTPEARRDLMEEEKRKAIMEATIYYNGTQQSNHRAFLSPMQVSRTMANRMFSVYQNASIGFARRFVTSMQDMGRIAHWNKEVGFYTKKIMREAEMAGNSITMQAAKTEAQKYLLKEARKKAFEAIMYGMVMNFIWDLGGKGFLSLFRDDDNEEDTVKGMLTNPKYLATLPARGTTGMNIIGGLANGQKVGNLLLDELSNVVDEYKWTNDKYGIVSPEMAWYVAQHGGKMVGVDPKVWANTYLGVEDMVRHEGWKDSDRRIIDLMFLMNSPESNRVQVAKTLYKDRPIEEYMEAVKKAAKYKVENDSYESWLPALKAIKQSDEKKLINEFQEKQMTPEQRRTRKDVKLGRRRSRSSQLLMRL